MEGAVEPRITVHPVEEGDTLEEEVAHFQTRLVGEGVRIVVVRVVLALLVGT